MAKDKQFMKMAAQWPLLNLFSYDKPYSIPFCFRHQSTINAEQGFGYEGKCYETCENNMKNNENLYASLTFSCSV